MLFQEISHDRVVPLYEVLPSTIPELGLGLRGSDDVGEQERGEDPIRFVTAAQPRHEIPDGGHGAQVFERLSPQLDPVYVVIGHCVLLKCLHAR